MSWFADVAGNVHRVNIGKAAGAGWTQGTTATIYDPAREWATTSTPRSARMLKDLVRERFTSAPHSGA